MMFHSHEYFKSKCATYVAMHRDEASRLGSRAWRAKIDIRHFRKLVAQHAGALSISLLSCLALTWLAGCKPAVTTVDSGMAWSSVDPWYRRPSGRSDFYHGERIPASDIIEISAAHRSAAEELLRDADCVEITAARAKELTGRSLSPANGKSLYLVRAVYLNRETGGFTATSAENELLVHHGCMGGSAVPMKRTALVIPLPQKPRTVFVDCSMAE